MTAVDVTVVVATRNRPQLLRRSLASIARQTLASYEVYVTDDGSDADEAAQYPGVFAEFDERFHLIEALKPGGAGRGPAGSRNRGIVAGTGRYVAFIDDDDYWTWEDHLKVAVSALDRANADFYCADMQGFRGDRLMYPTFFPHREQLVRGPRVNDDPPIYECDRAAIVGAAELMVPHPNVLVVRRALIEQAGGFLKRLHYAEDLEFALRLADRSERFLFCDKVVARHRLPEGNSSSLANPEAAQHLQSLAAMQHLRVVAVSKEVRMAARRGEAWALRQLSRTLRNEGRPATALAMALQAIAVRPTLRSFYHAFRLLVPSQGWSK